MRKLFIASLAIVLTAAAAQAMRWDGFRHSTNIEDRRWPGIIREAEIKVSPSTVTARNWVLPPDQLPTVATWANR